MFDDPLLDCLQLITRLHGAPQSADALRAGLPLNEGRLTPELLVRAAERAEFAARIVRRPLRQISELVLPAILLLEEGQACVAVAIDPSAGTVRIAQAEADGGEQTLALEALEARYTGSVLFARPRHRFDRRTPDVLEQRPRHWFWGTLASSNRIYRDVIIASFLINGFALVSPFFIMNVYDRVVTNNAVETLWVLAIGAGIVIVFDLIMRTLRGYFIDVAGKKADVVMSALLFEKVMGLRMEARPQSVGAFASNLSAFESVRNFITSTTVTTLVDLPFVVLFLLVIAFLAGPIVLVPLIAIPVVLVYALVALRPLRRAVENTFRGSAQKNATLVESLAGVETIKAHGAEGLLQRRWEQTVGYIAHWGQRARILSASAIHVALFCQQLAVIATVVYGVYLIGSGDLTMGGLIACVILVGRALAPMGQVASIATNYHQSAAALKSLDRVMSQPVERPQNKTFVHRDQLMGSIEFQGVSFAYPNQTEEALTDVSLRIGAGERVAIIGRTGSGKTTLERLILGLYEPTAGAVRIDGIDLRQIDPAELRRNIGYVAQDVTLFFGSLKDNILLGAPQADDRELLRAANISGVSEFADRHPLGFDLAVGERGESLSGGQRQSIAIARALITNPPMLIMDEPTGSMDQATEERLKLKLRPTLLGKTVLLVTHRGSLMELVDRVIVLDRGRVVADGPKARILEALARGEVRGASQ